MNLETVTQVILSQYEAALSTLGWCIDSCPDEAFNAPVIELAFCQTAFHALFYCDYYLGEDEATFKSQAFHVEHADVFRDYEELEYRKQRHLYERAFLLTYLEHCVEKARVSLANATEESLSAPCGFERRPFSRLELHVVSIRHVQHHAAQLGMRLRVGHGVEMPWVQSGMIDGR